jgi:hypothetical protein
MSLVKYPKRGKESVIAFVKYSKLDKKYKKNRHPSEYKE